MVCNRSSLYLFYTLLVFFFSDSVLLSSTENEPKQHVHESGGASNNNNEHEVTNKYPFDNVYYTYKIRSNELIKDAKLDPPIKYKSREKHRLALEPIFQFCKVTDVRIFTKLSAILLDNNIYINVDEDLSGLLLNNSTIVYKLKAINKDNSIDGETTVLIQVIQFFSNQELSLEFENFSYSIKASYGRKGKIFKFKLLKKKLNIKETKVDLQFEKQFENNEQEFYSFNGNYSLEYVPDELLTKLRINKDGYLEVMGNIKEGFYVFDVVAIDYGSNSSNFLRAKTKVHLFIDNIAVCNSDVSHFIRSFSKHYITEETKLHTAIPATEFNSNCSFAISHQYPLGVGDDFFDVDSATGAVHVMKPVDREAYAFEDAEEPSVYLKLRAYCPPLSPSTLIAIQPFVLPIMDHIVYDPFSTLIQLIIVDTNDNAPIFTEKRMIVGYPVYDVTRTVVPKHLVQAKATDKDIGKYGKIKYSLRGQDANDFTVNPETGMVYCTRPTMNNTDRMFEIIAKDNDGKPGGMESMMTVIVKSLTFSNIIRVNVKFSIEEDYLAIETQLSEISDVKIMSLTSDVVNTFTDNKQWRTERTLIIYGLNVDDSLELGSDLEKKLAHNVKILKISKYVVKSDNKMGTSLVCIALICLILSLVAMSLLYFGYARQIDPPIFKSKVANNAINSVIMKNSLYKAVPTKQSIDMSIKCNSSTVKLESKLSFEDEMIKLEKMEDFSSPIDDHFFNY